MPDLNNFLNHFRDGFQHENRFLVQIQTRTVYDAMKNRAAATGRPGFAGLIENIFSTLLGEGTNDVAFAADMLNRGLLCESSRLPSRSLSTMPQTMYGFTENFPIATEYVPIDCTFKMPLFGTQNPFINSLENWAVGSLLPSNIQVNLKNPATNPLPLFFSMWQNLIQNGTDGPDSGFNLSFPADYYTTMQLITFDRQDNATLIYMFDRVYPLTIESSEVAWAGEDHSKLQVSFMYSYWRMVKPNPSTLSIGVNTPIGGGTITF